MLYRIGSLFSSKIVTQQFYQFASLSPQKNTFPVNHRWLLTLNGSAHIFFEKCEMTKQKMSEKDQFKFEDVLLSECSKVVLLLRTVGGTNNLNGCSFTIP